MKNIGVALAMAFSLATATRAFAEPLDITAGSPYCQASRTAHPELDKQVVPAWEVSGQSDQVRPAIPEIEETAHELNAHFLRNMADSTYHRLAAARQIGLDLEVYRRGFEQVRAACGAPDRSGAVLKAEADRLASLPSEVEQDFQAFGLPAASADQELYLRRLIVATLEARRIRNVLSYVDEGAQRKPSSLESHELNEMGLTYVRRLLRLQHRYPVLMRAKSFDGAATFETAVENEIFAGNALPMGPRALFHSDPALEEKLALAPAGLPGIDLPEIALDPAVLTGGEDFYPRLYDAILSGRRPLSPNLRTSLRRRVDLSVRESIGSALLKCQNVSPCTALSVQPDLAATVIEGTNRRESLGPLACACRIHEQHEFLAGGENLALGLVSAGAVLVATLNPADWLLIPAYALAYADIGAAAAGMGDSYINVKRTDLAVLARAGGAVDPIQQFESENAMTVARYNTYYNLATGAIGLLPPGRILARGPGMTAREILRTPDFLKQANLEISKGATGAPAPELHTDHYASTYDPRTSLAPLPIAIRERWPQLEESLDTVAQATARLDVATRDLYLTQLKAAARQMAAAGTAADLEMLARGHVRRSLLPVTSTVRNFSLVEADDLRTAQVVTN